VTSEEETLITYDEFLKVRLKIGKVRRLSWYEQSF